MVVLAGGMMSAGAITAVVQPTQFAGLDCDELVSAYKHAFVDAGFDFEKEKIQNLRGHVVTTLVFRFSLPEFRGKEPGIASFLFDSRVPKDQDRVSCSAFREGFGGGDESYSYEEWNTLYAKMVSADLTATNRVKNKLGISLPPAE